MSTPDGDTEQGRRSGRDERPAPGSTPEPASVPGVEGAPLRDIKALSAEELGQLVSDIGLPAYRAGQLVSWLHGRGVADFSDMTDLPASLREALAARFSRVLVPVRSPGPA